MSPAAESEAAAQPQTQGDSPVCPCPILYALEALVIGEDEAPLSGIALELRNGSQAMRGRTDSEGLARFEGLPAAAYQLCPYELDKDAWTFVRTEPLPPELALSHATAAWEAPVPDLTDADGQLHTVATGDCVDHLALDHGLFSDAVWDHARNQSLRSRRESRNVLQKNDQVFIPPIRRNQVDAQVTKRHILKRRGVPSRLRIRLFNDLQQLGNIAWTLRISGQATLDGTTNSNGILEAWVPASASSATLAFVSDGEAREVSIALGALIPAHESGGWRQRLRNLGFRCEPDESKELSAEDQGALERFQDSWGLPVTGKPDSATIDKIYAVHDGAPTEAASSGLYAQKS
jgi:hypothetical protein